MIAVLITQRTRAAYLSGELGDLEEIFPAQTLAALNSDASIMASLALVNIAVQSSPVRAISSAVMVLLTPILYAMLTLPLPAGLEGTAVRRLSHAAQLLGVAVLFFFVSRALGGGGETRILHAMQTESHDRRRESQTCHCRT
jgi:hypothetical protein